MMASLAKGEEAGLRGDQYYPPPPTPLLLPLVSVLGGQQRPATHIPPYTHTQINYRYRKDFYMPICAHPVIQCLNFFVKQVFYTLMHFFIYKYIFWWFFARRNYHFLKVTAFQSWPDITLTFTPICFDINTQEIGEKLSKSVKVFSLYVKSPHHNLYTYTVQCRTCDHLYRVGINIYDMPMLKETNGGGVIDETPGRGLITVI